MIVLLQVVGVVAALIGVVALYYGIPVKEFSFGNTLILVGTISLCTGAILFALSVVALEVRAMARRLASGRPAQDSRARSALSSFSPSAGATEGDDSSAFDPLRPVSVQVEVPRVPSESEPAQAAPPSSRPKRNLLFQSSMRRERAEASSPETTQPPVSQDRARGSETPPSRRAGRLSATPAEAGAPAVMPPLPRSEAQPAVTVLKSGVVDGMAYSLYSDGSIEAQMPEGLMRFASIDELRAHLDHRS